MEIIARTDKGNIREINQDSVSFYQKGETESIIVLCDGMGGHNAGEVASQLACEDIIFNFKIHDEFQNDEEIESWLKTSILHANTIIQQESEKDAAYLGMGTTIVVGLIKNDHMYISHVGDSRAYFYLDEQLNQLTRDDTYVNMLVESGTITEEQANHHPQKNILLQAVGVSDSLHVSFYKQVFEKGILVFCSDGLYNSLTDEQLINVLKQEKSLKAKADELIFLANIYGGYDNIGFILVNNKGEQYYESRNQ